MPSRIQEMKCFLHVLEVVEYIGIGQWTHVKYSVENESCQKMEAALLNINIG